MPDEPFEPGEPGGAVVAPEKETGADRPTQGIPRYNLLLWDSDDHTYDYVEKMLRELIGHTKEHCHKIAEEVDTEGKAVVLTTSKEHAELKRDQIHAYGKDHIEGSKGAMWATIESVD